MQDGGIPATREEAIEDGKLNQYAHLYDVAREKEEREEADETLKKELDIELNVISPKHVAQTAISNTLSGLAIGNSAKNYSIDSVAIGHNTISNRATEFSVGSGDASRSPKTRYIANVTDPTLDNDAATKHYVDTQIANLPTSDVTKAYVDKQDQATILSASQLADAAERAAVAAAAAMFSTTVTDKRLGTVKASASISAADDGTITVNPGIFSDGLSTEDGQVSVDLGYIGEHLAGDALYYDSTDGLMLKVGEGLEIQNDAVSLDADALPLATKTTRGTVIIGAGLGIDSDRNLLRAMNGTAIDVGESDINVVFDNVTIGTDSHGALTNLRDPFPAELDPMFTFGGGTFSGTGTTSKGYVTGSWYGGRFPFLRVSSIFGHFTTSSAFASGTTIQVMVSGNNTISLGFTDFDAANVTYSNASIKGASTSFNRDADVMMIEFSVGTAISSGTTVYFFVG